MPQHGQRRGEQRQYYLLTPAIRLYPWHHYDEAAPRHIKLTFYESTKVDGYSRNTSFGPFSIVFCRVEAGAIINE